MGLDVPRLVEALVAQGTLVRLSARVDELMALQVESRCEVLVTMFTLQQSANGATAFPSTIPSNHLPTASNGIGRHVVTARSGRHTRPLQVTTKENQRPRLPPITGANEQ